jgi:hypothetical protein
MAESTQLGRYEIGKVAGSKCACEKIQELRLPTRVASYNESQPRIGLSSLLPRLGSHHTQLLKTMNDRLHSQRCQQDAENPFGDAKRLRIDIFQDSAF